MGQSHHETSPRSDLETDQVLGPVLIRAQVSSPVNVDVEATDLLGCLPPDDFDKGDLVAFVSSSYRGNGVGAGIQVDDRPGFEERQVFILEVEPQKAVQTMGSAETPDLERALSRGTRLQLRSPPPRRQHQPRLGSPWP